MATADTVSMLFYMRKELQGAVEGRPEGIRGTATCRPGTATGGHKGVRGLTRRRNEAPPNALQRTDACDGDFFDRPFSISEGGM